MEDKSPLEHRAPETGSVAYFWLVTGLVFQQVRMRLRRKLKLARP